ncbi:MAG TPA: phospho-N-acetylmuramoyl-pentapeptide-transferase [Candidatus Nanopelagicaceae bacterium]|nr:phospho-N-acetylmuramoyl-pentapeptide-transferase [Candidatus Nanopelagicaceae bacterium]
MKGFLLAASLAFMVSIFGTPLAIRFFIRHGYGQFIRDDGPTSHHTKRGTPTMGGVVIIFATLIGYFGSRLIMSRSVTASGILILFLMSGLGFVGFLDDWLKVSKQRSMGLRARSKIFGQAIVAIAFAILGQHFPDDHGLTPISSHLSIVRDTSLKLSTVLVVIWVLVMVTAESNGVNLTDGLDGLATGASVMTFGAFVLIGSWEFGQGCLVAPGPKCYEVRDPLDVAIVAASLMGACFGFLWWNASPAKIFMGDTGSLALGGALAGLAIASRTELLLLLLGGLYLIISLSVIVQVGFFKLTRGRRILRMAPLQHHFELLGWGEVTIVIRFWIIAGMCVGSGLGLFYAAWVTG